eukprot:TRINITY_DN5917_c0_g1_i2.p1 TRINITY_DN5917_c0_g1~~TRINITY_DN5917_c0_g1_i2.p1  ORF type:complete len:455 (-),score=116.50 TRINITY_DN5917_c0_g1_i2:133-1497(-)
MNPMQQLRQVLEKICRSRGLDLEEHIAEDMNGRHLSMDTLLGDIPNAEITFMNKADVHQPGIRRRGANNNNADEPIPSRLVQSVKETPTTEPVKVGQRPLTSRHTQRFLKVGLSKGNLRGQINTGTTNAINKIEITTEQEPEENIKKRKNRFNDFILEEEIGSGAFSTVHRGIHKQTKEMVAIKIIDKFEEDKEEEKIFRREIKILKSLDHEYVIGLRGLDEDKQHFYVIMELVTGGELFDELIERGYYTEMDAVPIIKQILEAVEYMHSIGVVHRDLKPENLLFEDDNHLVIKLADFGESKNCKKSKLKTYCGTPDYMAPEIIKGEQYTNAVDMWAIGVITYVMLCGFPTFDGQNDQEVFDNIISVVYDYPSPEWDIVGDNAKNFIDSILVSNPEERLTATGALQHPWIVNTMEKWAEIERNYIEFGEEYYGEEYEEDVEEYSSEVSYTEESL